MNVVVGKTLMFAELIEDLQGDLELVHELLVVIKIEFRHFVDALELAITDEYLVQVRELRHQIKPCLEMFRL